MDDMIDSAGTHWIGVVEATFFYNYGDMGLMLKIQVGDESILLSRSQAVDVASLLMSWIGSDDA